MGKEMMWILSMQFKSSCFDSPILRTKTSRDGRLSVRAIFGLLVECSHYLLKNKVDDVLNSSLQLEVDFEFPQVPTFLDREFINILEKNT